MPALFTHILLADDVLRACPEPPTERGAFVWGALGPDFLFFHRAMPYQLGRSLNRLGTLLHRQAPDRLFGAMLSSLATLPPGAQRERARAYAQGFLCHFALDRIAHPFVYYHERAYREQKRLHCPGIFLHNQIEHNLDALLLRELRGATVRALPPEALLPDDAPVLDAAAELLRTTLAALFDGMRVKVGALRRAFRDTAQNVRRLCGGPERRRRILAALERALHTGPALSSLIWSAEPDGDYDYANRARALWYDLTAPERPRRESFLDLYGAARERTLALIAAFASCEREGRAPDFCGDAGFNAGKLPARKKSGRRDASSANGKDEAKK